jgi:hypothetical protein
LSAQLVNKTGAKVVHSDAIDCPRWLSTDSQAHRRLSSCDGAFNRERRAIRFAGGPRRDGP